MRPPQRSKREVALNEFYDEKRAGFSRIGKSVNFKEKTLCPICKKPAKGIRPEGYMHPNGKGFETTYCKVER